MGEARTNTRATGAGFLFALVALGLAGAYGVWRFLPEPSWEAPPSSDAPESQIEADDGDFPTVAMGPRQPPITEIDTVPVFAAGAVADQELVIGVTINQESRAYPLNMINGPTREVLNDVVGEIPIVVTWCPICHHAAVFRREVDGRVLRFGVSGRLWNDNMVLYDAETNTLWSQLLGRGMSGPQRGRRLEPIASILTDWKSWRDRQPSGTVAVLSRTAGDYVSSYYREPEKFVLATTAVSPPRAWGFDTLTTSPALNVVIGDIPALVAFRRDIGTARLFDRRVAGWTLTFRGDGHWLTDDQTGTLWDPVAGRGWLGLFAGESLNPLPASVAFRRAWLAFHPDTQMLPAQSGLPDEVVDAETDDRLR
jgi:hypothetical protein